MLMYLFFIVPPNITTPVNNSTRVIDEGTNITLTCESTGIPSPVIIWSRTNGAINDSQRVSVGDSVTGLFGMGNVTKVSVSLTILNASREDRGMYTCSASNSAGSDSSSSFITVLCKIV